MRDHQSYEFNLCGCKKFKFKWDSNPQSLQYSGAVVLYQLRIQATLGLVKLEVCNKPVGDEDKASMYMTHASFEMLEEDVPWVLYERSYLQL